MVELLLLAFIFLCAGVAAVPVASRLGLGSVLGYLIAGIAISPLLAAFSVDVVSIQHFAEFGVVMMLFLVGLELEPKLLWQMRNRLLGLGGLQVGLTTLAVMGVAMALGHPWTLALAIGLVLALSSTAIVLQTLNEKGLMRSDGGQSSFSVLLFQDIAVIPMLALMPLLALPELADTVGALESAGHGAEGGAGDHGGGHGDAGHGEQMSLVAGLAGWQPGAGDASGHCRGGGGRRASHPSDVQVHRAGPAAGDLRCRRPASDDRHCAFDEPGRALPGSRDFPRRRRSRQQRVPS